MTPTTLNQDFSCPWERNIEKDHEYKERKYAPLVADLERDYRVYQFLIEISARGFISKENKSRIKAFLLKVCDVSHTTIINTARHYRFYVHALIYFVFFIPLHYCYNDVY